MSDHVMGDCKQCGVENVGTLYGLCNKCRQPSKYPSTSDVQTTSSDDRHFAVIHVVLYDDARRERVLDRFGVNAWVPDSQFRTLKEFFLANVRHTELFEGIEVTQELMK